MKLYNESPLSGVTTSDLKTVIQLSQNRVGELLKQLYDMGFLRRDKEGKEYRYFPTEKKFENIKVEDITFTENELELWKESKGLGKK